MSSSSLCFLKHACGVVLHIFFSSVHVDIEAHLDIEVNVL